MPQLGKLAQLGIARETTNDTYVAPTDFIPFNKADYEDQYVTIKDESYRGNDSGLQGLYQGVSEADWTIDLFAYPLITGYFLRGIIGPDTVVPGVSTTTSASSSIGATSITVTSATGITTGTVLRIGSGATLEYATAGTPSGTTIPVTGTGTSGGLLYAHTSGAAVATQATHTFAQSINPANRATFSLTIFDTLGNFSYSGAAMSDLDVKIDPKGAVTLQVKMKAFQFATASSMTVNYDASDPILAWEWNMTNAGASSNRGTSLDLKIKRKIDVIHASDGNQSPRDIFQGALDVDGTYKAIYENQTDLNLFLQNIQQPVTANMTQPLAKGAAQLNLTMSQTGWFKGKRDWSNTYVQGDFSFSGIYNTTDGGLVQAQLINWKNTAY